MQIINWKDKFKESQTKNWIPLDPNKVEFIFIHHPMARFATVEQINQWHLNNGWIGGIGYNEYITKDGTVHICRGDNIGAQSHKHNSISYGICLEGNYDIEPSPPPELYEIIAKRVIENQKKYIKAKTVLPHSARNSTACPGKNFNMNKLYDAINKLNEEREKIKEHWAEEIYKELAENFGLTIHEKRFDDKITRAESMALLLQGLKSIKKYIDIK